MEVGFGVLFIGGFIIGRVVFDARLRRSTRRHRLKSNRSPRSVIDVHAIELLFAKLVDNCGHHRDQLEPLFSPAAS